MKGNIIAVEQGEGIFEGTLGIFGVRSDGKLKKRKIKAVPKEMTKKELLLQCRSYRPDQLIVCVQPDKDNLIMFEFDSLTKDKKYKGCQGRHHASGKFTSWGCSFKMK